MQMMFEGMLLKTALDKTAAGDDPRVAEDFDDHIFRFERIQLGHSRGIDLEYQVSCFDFAPHVESPVVFGIDLFEGFDVIGQESAPVRLERFPEFFFFCHNPPS